MKIRHIDWNEVCGDLLEIKDQVHLLGVPALNCDEKKLGFILRNLEKQVQALLVRTGEDK